MSLRKSLSAAIGLLGVLALGAAVALIVLSTYLHESSVSLASALESVRLTEEMQVDLLTHTRAGDPVVRTALESELRRKLERAHLLAGSEEERQALRRAEADLAAYLGAAVSSPGGAPPDDATLGRVFQSFQRVVRLNVRVGNEAARAAERLDRLADGLGSGMAIALVLGVGAVMTWLLAFAFRPVFRLRDAMRSFASGDRSARVPESGPAELRLVSQQFNEMAAALERRRTDELVFLGGVAHDLRGPVSVLRLSTAQISPERPLPDEAHVRALLARVARQVDRLDRMIGDFLDGARIEAGQLELCLERHDARELVTHSASLFDGSSPLHRLVLELPGEPVPLICDPVRVEQVLNNLVSNAIKYSPHGGTVRIAVRPSRAEVIFTVSDEGIGISAEDLPHVFEPFRRTSASRDTAPGVGLGLSIARRIVEAHHGQIEVTSRPGRGTTFAVRFPADPREESASVSPAAPA